MSLIRFVKILFLSISFSTFAQEVAVLKYNGGGDWYANPTAIPNLIEFSNKNIKTKISKSPTTVSVGSSDLFNFPIVFMTGHGNVFFTDQEAKNLRQYLISGGFLHISDNYGLDKYIRTQLKKVFPKIELIEIPFSHAIFNQTFTFNKGLPKIHEHNKKVPQGFGLFFKGRLVCFYDYESDLSDGWEDSTVHNNPMETRIKALQMGSNIIEYAFRN
ncbi:DUF4159 domain-containing protein [Flavobacteriaceae bacterium]|nr:DUF4159 domain-containing protein [Flavobacteriaceae bacterium]MDB4496991.1 DUF4159 domain-containing protein [Flavobacteriaceae bacterium]MDC1168099.1 DUF4159 domain-containing protein [Flavobacteriaceae bacterium]MDC3285005.1 DUF4159 domain-containing protein [Flavobacteriaceae bacterium]MDC3319851.1 DUF4159 domain-containing protein [Flavobacteriaceae bacterium]